jgi:lactate permease
LPSYRPKDGAAPTAAPSGFHRAFSAYYILIGVVFVVFLIAPVRAWLNGLWEVGVSFPETQTAFGYTNAAVPVYAGIRMFTAPGTLIFLSVLLAYLFYRSASLWPKGGGQLVLSRTVKQAIGATRTMAHAAASSPRCSCSHSWKTPSSMASDTSWRECSSA